jgi:hypothetical protein
MESNEQRQDKTSTDGAKKDSDGKTKMKTRKLSKFNDDKRKNQKGRCAKKVTSLLHSNISCLAFPEDFSRKRHKNPMFSTQRNFSRTRARPAQIGEGRETDP